VLLPVGAGVPCDDDAPGAVDEPVELLGVGVGQFWADGCIPGRDPIEIAQALLGAVLADILL
jgi:hypothetical protein